MKFRKLMGAHSYEGNEHRVEFPCYVQPKLDGVRCATDGVRFWSRNGKLFPQMNVAHLQVFSRLDCLVDGELMVPDADFEDSISAVKHASDDDRSLARRLRFYAFDTVTERSFEYRKVEVATCVKHAKQIGAQWERVPTYEIRDERMLRACAKRLLADGHEGTMVRNAAGLYVPRKTFDLLKWKPLKDAEFRIVEVREAKGKDAGTPIFVCAVGKYTFRVRPKGTTKQRKAMWRDRKKMLRKMLTVEFQNLTKYGVPRFPRAKVLRDYE